MSKRFLAVLLLVLALLVSCSEKETMTPESIAEYAAPPFVMTTDFEINGIKGAASFRCNGIGDCELLYLAPENVSQLRIKKSGDVVTEEYAGLKTESEYAALKDENPIVVLETLFSHMITDTVEVSASDSEVTASANDGRIKAIFANGALKRVEAPFAKLVMRVSGFEHLQEKTKN
ncbi:MAG: hypothetical protein RR058_03455 [Oscillospiraceae bacterium]